MANAVLNAQVNIHEEMDIQYKYYNIVQGDKEWEGFACWKAGAVAGRCLKNSSLTLAFDRKNSGLPALKGSNLKEKSRTTTQKVIKNSIKGNVGQQLK